MDVLSPDFERYRKTKSLLFRYQVKIEIWDLETFQIIVHDRVTVDEDEIKGIDKFTVDLEKVITVHLFTFSFCLQNDDKVMASKV